MIHTTKQTVILLAASAILLLSSCKKDREENSTDPEDCVEGFSSGQDTALEGRYIVSYNSNVILTSGKSAPELAGMTAEFLAAKGINEEGVTATFTGETAGFIVKLSTHEAAILRADPSIKLVEPDRMIKLATCFTVAEPRLLTWNVRRVGYGDGTGKKVWILDTGIDLDHPDLTVDLSRSRSFLSGQASADDANGHGTHVAGIIGGKNNTIGVLGVASGATLISVRVLDASGEGPLSGIIQALSYVNANASAGDVVNLSLGEDATSLTLNNQIRDIGARGIYFAIAAGNDAVAANQFSPANASGLNIYTISAVDSLDNFASFSNYGNDVVDYAAPGVRILSCFTNGRYAYMSGTSMAAPHMAGILALRGRNFTTSGAAKNDPDGTPDPIVHY